MKLSSKAISVIQACLVLIGLLCSTVFVMAVLLFGDILEGDRYVSVPDSSLRQVRLVAGRYSLDTHKDWISRLLKDDGAAIISLDELRIECRHPLAAVSVHIVAQVSCADFVQDTKSDLLVLISRTDTGAVIAHEIRSVDRAVSKTEMRSAYTEQAHQAISFLVYVLLFSASGAVAMLKVAYDLQKDK